MKYKPFMVNDYLDLVRDIGGDLIEEVVLLDKYENVKKFGANKISYTFRVVYRSRNCTLTGKEVDTLHKKLGESIQREYGAILR